MCATCGCGEETATITLAGDTHPHEHRHDHPHPQPHPHPHDHPHEPEGQRITLEQRVLAKNDHLAEHNRRRFAERDITAVNLTSSPGSGKTTLLERTIAELGGRRPVAVIEGDQQTLLDAQRIQATGCRAVQVNTGAGCHLDADMVSRALDTLDPEPGTLLFIENVGNLVCPALFDLGERAMVVVISVTEGADKPLKYQHMFAAAQLVVINKIDLLPHVDFDLDVCAANVRSVNRHAHVLAVSATTGEGIESWLDWLATAATVESR